MKIYREPTGLKDKDGKEIYTGDIICFYYSADYGYGTKKSGYTKMVDIVIKEDNKFYAVCDLGLGAFLWRCSKYSQKIGTIKNKSLLKKCGFERTYQINDLPDIVRKNK